MPVCWQSHCRAILDPATAAHAPLHHYSQCTHAKLAAKTLPAEALLQPLPGDSCHPSYHSVRSSPNSCCSLNASGSGKHIQSGPCAAPLICTLLLQLIKQLMLFLAAWCMFRAACPPCTTAAPTHLAGHTAGGWRVTHGRQTKRTNANRDRHEAWSTPNAGESADVPAYALC